MDAKQAKRTVKAWVDANLGTWPGLRAAHLTGGITAMPDDAPFPAHKDVDLHLVFAEGSPALEAGGPFVNVIAASYGGIAIEAGVKSAAEYASAGTVLANPEIAHHLTLDPVLYDPDGLLRGLQEEVRREYARRRWVLARLEHERRGLDRAFELAAMARAGYGASGEVNILGYTTTFPTAALQVAMLSPLRMGSRGLVHLRQSLAARGRLDLHEELLAALGVAAAEPGRAEEIIDEAAEAFDLAVEIRRTPHPFQHKMHRHLRPYFVDSCRDMVADGHHREALLWAVAFHLAATDVILADAPAAEVPRFVARRDALLRELGLETAEARASTYARLPGLYDRIFALAEEIVAQNPRIVD